MKTMQHLIIQYYNSTILNSATTTFAITPAQQPLVQCERLEE